ncbi:hypothetical protein HPP92_004456 [Vanilla planifolia]|uniref:Uncharacterized protein n=1 Tax=Vanilla planifolia TaxID=51239 RepID=A0A835VJW8_VANPL|nr:hypothetical protein HPP92_004456 [Vanilla planifolia]
MPDPDGKSGDACVWFITCIFFLLILSGGAFLVLYIALPESNDNAWLPVAGMVLVAIPWLFWITTCVYRLSFPWLCAVPCCTVASPPAQVPGATVESEAESPGGARRVRFGAPKVIATQESGGVVGGGEKRPDGGSSSLDSRESEAPLALSMS